MTSVAVLAGEEGDGRLRGDRGHGGGERLEVLVLPALGPVDDDEAAAEGQRHRVQRRRHRLRGRLLALEQLQSLGPAERLGESAQAGATLGDAAVIVAVDQVGRLETWHLTSLGSRGDGQLAPAPISR